MKKVNFSYTGGFPFDQRTLDDMQSGYLDILTGLLGFLNIPPTGNHVIFGCAVAGPNITAGMMYIDGDLCSFAGAAGDGTTKIKKLVTTENAPFQNGSNNPVYITTTAVVDAAGAELSTFTRYNTQLVYDGNYVHTDNNFTTLLLTHLNSIAFGAEVNVNPNWTETNPALKSFIQNKPIGILRALKEPSTFIGISDLDGGENYEITFPTVGTANYIVLGVLVANNPASWGSNNNVTWAVTDKQETSFNLIMKEHGGGSQALSFDYLLIEIP